MRKDGIATLDGKEFNQVHDQHPKLDYNHERGTLVGLIDCDRTFEGKRVHLTYSVEIKIPVSYPQLNPCVTIVEGTTFNHLNPDGSLCLGHPIEVLRIFKENPSMIGFIDNILVPNLFWHAYCDKYGEEPWPAYSHADAGWEQRRHEPNLRGAYFGILETCDVTIALRLLKILIDESYKHNPICPCKSGQHLNNCHGKVMKTLLEIPHVRTHNLRNDYDKLFKEAIDANDIEDVRPFQPKRKRNFQLKRRRNRKRR